MNDIIDEVREEAEVWELLGKTYCKYCGSQIILDYNQVDYANEASGPTPRNLDGMYHSCAAKEAIKGIYNTENYEGESL